MKERAVALESSASGRFRLRRLFAFLFVAAQLIVAAHAAPGTDYLVDHSPASCAACLAGSASDDPALLTVGADKPSFDFVPAFVAERTRRLSSRFLDATRARAPPFC